MTIQPQHFVSPNVENHHQEETELEKLEFQM
jgi:hypothetical protein